MRTFEMRTYTLRSRADLANYAGTVYPRHLRSMPLFGVELHGFWTGRDDTVPRLFALVSYAEGDDPREVDERYLKSNELAADVHGFDTSAIVGVETDVLDPADGSPLS